MREILFRGKRVDNGDWVHGSFVPDALEMLNGLDGMDGFIRRYNPESHKTDMFDVERDTVGQYTGLTDKNGVKIFEGDILRIDDPEFIPVFGVVRFGKHDFNVGFFVEWLNDRIFYRNDLRYWAERPYCAVRGNIHDNPDLLEEES